MATKKPLKIENGITQQFATGDAVDIVNGGTGQITANAALNALLPSQTANSGKFVTTDGSNTSWAAVTVPSPAGANLYLFFNY